MSYTRRVLRGVTFVLLFSVVTSVFGYLQRLYLGRTLEPAGFGLVYGLLGLFGFVLFFVYLGLTEATVKFVSDFRAKGQKKNVMKTADSVLFLEIFLAVIVAIILFSISEWLASVYFKDAAAGLLIKVYSVAIIIMPLEAIIIKLFQAYQRPLYYSLIQLLRAAALLGLTLFFFEIFPKLGILAAILPYPITTLLLFAVYYPLFKRNVLPNYRISFKYYDAKLLKKIFVYGIPIAFTVLSSAILVHTDTVMITAFRDLAEVGLYNAALPIANILLFFGASVITVFFPLVAELWTKKKGKLLASVMGESYVLLLATAIPGAVLFFLFPDIILNILFGGKFVPAAPALKVLSIASLFATITMFNSAVLSGIGKPQLMTRAVVIGAVLNVIINLLLIPKLGFIGASFATLISQALIFGANTYYVSKSIQFKFPYRKLFFTMIAGAAMVPIVGYLRNALEISLIPKLMVTTFVLVVSYVALLFLFRVITIKRFKYLLGELL